MNSWIHVHTKTIYSAVDKVVMLEIVATITILLRELISNLSLPMSFGHLFHVEASRFVHDQIMYMTNLGTQYIHLAESYLCGFIVDSQLCLSSVRSHCVWRGSCCDL